MGTEGGKKKYIYVNIPLNQMKEIAEEEMYCRKHGIIDENYETKNCYLELYYPSYVFICEARPESYFIREGVAIRLND